jgi:uncharacterized membrane protein YcaP (DUF421 family)
MVAQASLRTPHTITHTLAMLMLGNDIIKRPWPVNCFVNCRWLLEADEEEGTLLAQLLGWLGDEYKSRWVALVEGRVLAEFLFPADWARIILPDVPIFELIIRVSVVYLVLYSLFRLVLKREVGAFGLTDILVVVLIADAVQNGMAGSYTSVGGALILGATLIFWDYALSWLSYHSHRLRHIIMPTPLLIVKNGVLIRRNLASELITEEELVGELRLQGIESIEDVWEARMEADGRISVIEKKAVRSINGGQKRNQRHGLR